LLAAERRFKIMKLVQKQKVVTTSELAALFDVSEITIRRNVINREALENSGKEVIIAK